MGKTIVVEAGPRACPSLRSLDNDKFPGNHGGLPLHHQFETDILIWATGYDMDLGYTGLEAYQNLTSGSQMRKKLGTFFVSLDYPNLYFTGVSILDSNATAPLVFSVIARSLVSCIKGTCNLPKKPVLNYVNHWDIIKLLARYDKANYFPFFWKIKYFLKAAYYKKFRNKPVSI